MARGAQAGVGLLAGIKEQLLLVGERLHGGYDDTGLARPDDGTLEPGESLHHRGVLTLGKLSQRSRLGGELNGTLGGDGRVRGQRTEQSHLLRPQRQRGDDGECLLDAFRLTLREDAAQQRGGQGLRIGGGLLEHRGEVLELTTSEAADETILDGDVLRGAVRERSGDEVDGEVLGFAHGQDELQLHLGDGFTRGEFVPAGDDLGAVRTSDKTFRDAQSGGTDARISVG